MTGSELTRRQRTVLSSLYFGNPKTAQWLGVRSDVLWRLEERGFVGRNADMQPKWHITTAGRDALDHADRIGTRSSTI